MRSMTDVARRRRRRRIAVAAAALAAVVVLLAAPACSALRAGAVLRDALQPMPEVETKVREYEGFADGPGAAAVRIRMAVPRERDGPWPACLLVHGAVDAGPDDPRLVAMARSLAAHGWAVGSVELAALERFRLDAEDPRRVAAAARWLADRADTARDGRVALAGISVGGSYAILAAEEPDLRGRVPAILAFGAYSDLEALLLHWMTTRADAPPGMLDPSTEGRRAVLLGNVDRLVPAAEAETARGALRDLLAGRPRAVPEGLSEATRRVLRAAGSAEPLSPDEAHALLAQFAGDLARLSPGRAAAPPTPVWLLHADADPVVPASDAATLAGALGSRGAEVEVHVTDLFGHVDARDGGSPSFLRAWPLLRFLGAFLDAAD
jgi:dienelactone hydrolase